MLTFKYVVDYILLGGPDGISILRGLNCVKIKTMLNFKFWYISVVNIKINPACWRHWISWLVQVGAPIPKQTEKEEKIKKEKISCVMDYMSGVGCHMSPVTNATATNSHRYRPSPANSPTMHGRLLWKDPKTKKYVKMHNIIEKKTKKTSRGMPLLVIHFWQEVSSPPGSGFPNMDRQTDIQQVRDIVSFHVVLLQATQVSTRLFTVGAGKKAFFRSD